ncbi:MAG: insulinase family protein [Clostridiales bacterium]|nr:insulinase family protein [Clostridiales bacterium]
MDKFVLKNGLTVLVEAMPYLRSASMGVWVKAGSMLEQSSENGLSHFMEHMAFKGTQKRTARQIAEEMDAVGGHLNASTSKLCTNYYAKVIDEDLPLAADVLSDIVMNPALDPIETDKERGVILEEISMVEDSPEDVVYDVLSEAVFGDQALGQTILGPAEKIAAYTPNDLRAFRSRHYGPKNAVVAVAGNVDRDQVRDLMEEKFGGWESEAGEEFPVSVAIDQPRKLFRDKDTEQVHLCLSFRGTEMGSKEIYPAAVMNTVLGGGMSSRLFQRIREELGMAYSVYSGPSNYPHCGEFTIYAATSPKHAKTVLEQIDIELKKFLDSGITEKEFSMAKAQLKGSFILGLESAYNRMSALGHNQILLGKVIPPEETIAAIEKVSMEDVKNTSHRILTGPRAYAVVGKKAEKYLQYMK